MAQSKPAKKSGRHHRHNQSERVQNTLTPHKETLPDEQSRRDVQAERAPDAALALLTGPENDELAQAQRKSMPLALIPQHLPAVSGEPQRVVDEAVPVPKRRFSTVVQAVLISGCVTAALVFTLGALKSTRSETQVALTDVNASLAVPASKADTAVPTVNEVPTPKKRTVATQATRVNAKSPATATKPSPPTSHTAKNADRAATGKSLHPAADNAKKKPAPAIAKAPAKSFETQPAPVASLNTTILASKSTGTQNKYAQCQERGNFLQREQCKWQVCNGKWGQDGCPSYANDHREFN